MFPLRLLLRQSPLNLPIVLPLSIKERFHFPLNSTANSRYVLTYGHVATLSLPVSEAMGNGPGGGRKAGGGREMLGFLRWALGQVNCYCYIRHYINIITLNTLTIEHLVCCRCYDKQFTCLSHLSLPQLRTYYSLIDIRKLPVSLKSSLTLYIFEPGINLSSFLLPNF